MKHTYGKQARRAGLALAAVTAISALGIGTAQAQQFASASIDLDQGGALVCKFRETGLGASALITYTCGAQAVGVVTGCFVKNKYVGPQQVAFFQNVSNAGEHGETGTTLLSNNSGTINGTIAVEIPEGGAELQCDEASGAEPQLLAVRWCNASLVDTTNGITGATAADLLATFGRSSTVVPIIPTCAEILAAPPSNGGEG